jgi:CelD/BcsL family acetyltransferase involved in cellulose biosynthesis
MIRVAEIADFEAFLALEPEWTSFCESSGAGSLFLSHCWFRCCWVGKPEDVQPLVLVAREGRAIVGIAPFFVHTSPWRIFPLRTALLMQNQDSPFADCVIVPDRVAEILGAFVAHLTEAVRCHVVSLRKIVHTSPTYHVLAGTRFAAPLIRAAAGGSPILSLQGDWSEFWTRQSQRFKKTVRNVANRIERLGPVSVDEVSATFPADECLEIYRSVAERGWKAQLPISLGRNPAIARFFEAVTPVLQARQQLLLWVLRLDGVPIAAEYHVQDGNVVYALRSDFDDRYSEASPGAFLNEQIVRAYFERRLRAYDMGPGDNAYKQRWATGATEFDDFSFFSRRPYPLTVYTFEQHAVPRLRQARDWWRRDGAATTSATPWSGAAS